MRQKKCASMASRSCLYETNREDICVGSISERQIVQGILKESDPKQFYEKPVSEIMQEQFPVVDEGLAVTAVALLLQHSQANPHCEERKDCGNHYT